MSIQQKLLPMPEKDPRYAAFNEGKTKTTFTRQDVNSSELSLLSNEYDVFFRRIENLNSVFVVLGTAGAITAAAGVSVVTMGVGIIPIITLVSFVPLIGRCAQLFPAQWFKTAELEYISGACLSMVTNMSDDLINLKKFYKIVDDHNKNESSVKIPECTQPVSLYSPVEKNLYKFMFILLNAMDFNTNRSDLGALHYSFLAGLFNYCDFENSRFQIVDGKAEETDAEKNDKSFKYRYTYSEECRYSKWQEDNISHNKYSNNNYARSCNNLNDTIVRLLEHKFLGAKNVLSEMLLATMTPPLSSETKTKIEKFLNDNKNNFDSSNRAARGFKNLKTTLVGSPNQCYREMLREYTIMTGNWSMITSKYALQYNHFILMVGADEYKTKLGLIDTKIAPHVQIISDANGRIEKDIDFKNSETVTGELSNEIGTSIRSESDLTDNMSENSSGSGTPVSANNVNAGLEVGGKRKSKRHRKRATNTKKRR
jgi:hypothetical protein